MAPLSWSRSWVKWKWALLHNFPLHHSLTDMGSVLPYATNLLSLQILDHTFQIQVVANPGVLLDELIDKGDAHEDVLDERIPYWAELWPSAVGLAQFLLRRQAISPGEKVLELGCGLGLPGIAAGALGGLVTLSDYLQPALDFAERNWQLNHHKAVELALLDWREPAPGLAADCVLASDITYEERNFPYLPAAFRQLCRQGGKVIISDPRRQKAQSFFAGLPGQGFTVEKWEEQVFFHQLEMTIHVYIIEMKE